MTQIIANARSTEFCRYGGDVEDERAARGNGEKDQPDPKNEENDLIEQIDRQTTLNGPGRDPERLLSASMKITDIVLLTSSDDSSRDYGP